VWPQADATKPAAPAAAKKTNAAADETELPKPEKPVQP